MEMEAWSWVASFHPNGSFFYIGDKQMFLIEHINGTLRSPIETSLYSFNNGQPADIVTYELDLYGDGNPKYYGLGMDSATDLHVFSLEQSCQDCHIVLDATPDGDTAGSDAGYGAAWVFANNLYFGDNKGSGVYRIDFLGRAGQSNFVTPIIRRQTFSEISRASEDSKSKSKLEIKSMKVSNDITSSMIPDETSFSESESTYTSQTDKSEHTHESDANSNLTLGSSFLPAKDRLYMVNLSTIPSKKIEVTYDADCSICLKPMKVGQRKRVLFCRHDQFHADCISEWLKENNGCPLCRQEKPIHEENEEEDNYI